MCVSSDVLSVLWGVLWNVGMVMCVGSGVLWGVCR